MRVEKTHEFRADCCELVREGFEFLVHRLPPPPFLLLQLDLIFVAVPVLPLPVPGLVELNVRGLAVELDVLSPQSVTYTKKKDLHAENVPWSSSFPP